MRVITWIIYEVLADGNGDGPAGDGTYVYRFRNLKEARAFARTNTYLGGPIQKDQILKRKVPRQLAQRWGL